MNYSEARNRLARWIGAQLTGPASDNDLLQGVQPTDRYPAGFLSPLIEDQLTDLVLPDDEPDALDDDITDAHADSDGEPAAVAQSASQRQRFVPPSSAGFSFYAVGPDIKFQVVASAVRYQRVGDRDSQGRFSLLQFQRHVLQLPEESIVFSLSPAAQRKRTHHVIELPVLEGRARLDVAWRPQTEGWIVTVSLSNLQTLTAESLMNRNDREEKTLFEASLRAVIDSGSVGDYPRVDFSLLSDEERELEFQYRHRKIYAVGHGSAVDWQESNGRVTAIWLDFLPTVEVPQVTADTAGDSGQVLSLAYLGAGTDNSVLDDEVRQSLQTFIDDYQLWVNRQSQTAAQAGDIVKPTAERIVDRMAVMVTRMQSGLDYLAGNPTAADAFRIANRAMLLQMHRSARNKGGSAAQQSIRWRPFQLAFLLAVAESSVVRDDPFRDTVDLIWFPTGGGKTEAYLALIAFVLAARRLANLNPADDAGGTAVLMRYTLRLLTAQQFLRATKMICALELIRRAEPRLGQQPFECGLWVGAAASPNYFSEAAEIVAGIAAGNLSARKRLVFDRCPWCETPFSSENYRAGENAFVFSCTHSGCEFGNTDNGVLPCNVVDEALYQSPPSLLLATIDKFARLVWNERTHVFFGAGRYLPPELIVQDELHLVAGELGSVAGLYEAAIDTVLQQRGVRAKYVASTATIRMAQQQVTRLYGRELAVFPPPGLSADDSYFARTVPLHVRPGRLYVGFLAPLLKVQNCMVPLVAAIIQAPLSVFPRGEVDREQLLEAWWTMVVYHGSLKGVGNSHNSFNSTVRDSMARLIAERDDGDASTQALNASGSEPSLQRQVLRVAQLTSLSGAEDNANTFNQLENTVQQGDYLDVVLATNMVSVGLDVSRLALMVINGQPLTTAEYIQTSSRVGRAEVPGLVFTNYYRSQARSLSHYENFRAYHESFYRFVEPTSVTPFTYQARRRALHTAMVLVVRHVCPALLADNTAGDFRVDDPLVQSALDLLKQRCAQADPARADEVAQALDALAAQWSDFAVRSAQERVQLKYTTPNKDTSARRLFHSFEDAAHASLANKGLWPALNSMRNVENTGLLRSAVVTAGLTGDGSKN